MKLQDWLSIRDPQWSGRGPVTTAGRFNRRLQSGMLVWLHSQLIGCIDYPLKDYLK